jgi:hypothetical protein
MAPVFAGLAFFGLLGFVMWGIAAVMSGEQSQSTTFTPDRLQIGNVQRWSESIQENGPVLFPGLGTTSGERTLVLNHTGTNPERGWAIYYAHPNDRPPSCVIEQIITTDTFTDCDGRTISVVDLAPPANGEFPIIEDRTMLYIDLGRSSIVSTSIAS